jgi:ParB-like chromosome segregation protein Spo0J
MNQWTDRVIARSEVDPATLVANPANFREHPPNQRRHLEAMLAEIGWVEEVIVNRETGRLVDGHLRVALALDRGESTVPVAYVELSEADEQVALATIDQITAMAYTDDAALVGLLDDIPAGLADWMRVEGRAAPQPTQAQIDETTEALQNRFANGEDNSVEVECPGCGAHFGIAGIGVTS